MDDSVLSVNSTVSAYDAAKLMEEFKTGAIVVLENQTPVGLVTNKRSFNKNNCSFLSF